MKYSVMLQQAIHRKQITLSELSIMLKNYGFKTNKAYISKLQNGKLPPAGDKFNEALATVLGIDPVEFKTAAYREKIPAEVLEKLQNRKIPPSD